MHYFPLWEKELHDVLQKHFPELTKIFLAYTKSIGGSGSAEDAIEMDMSEFKDFVDECGLETKAIGFELMTNNFTKANATNNTEAREAAHERRRSAGTKMDAPTNVVKAVAQRNDGTAGGRSVQGAAAVQEALPAQGGKQIPCQCAGRSHAGLQGAHAPDRSCPCVRL